MAIRLEVEIVNVNAANRASAPRIVGLALGILSAAALSGCHTYDIVIEVRNRATQAPVADAEIEIEYLRMLSLKPEVAPLHFRTDAAGRVATRFDFREPVADVRLKPSECKFARVSLNEDDLKSGRLARWEGGFLFAEQYGDACNLEWRAWIGVPTSSPPPPRERKSTPLWLPPS